MPDTDLQLQRSPTDDGAGWKVEGGRLRDRDEYFDLCTTCDFRDDCLRRSTLIRPVYFCEEFSTHARPAQNPYITPLPPVQKAAPVTKPRYGGLCVNCDHREHCRHACTEGGIWHCEEYC